MSSAQQNEIEELRRALAERDAQLREHHVIVSALLDAQQGGNITDAGSRRSSLSGGRGGITTSSMMTTHPHSVGGGGGGGTPNTSIIITNGIGGNTALHQQQQHTGAVLQSSLSDKQDPETVVHVVEEEPESQPQHYLQHYQQQHQKQQPPQQQPALISADEALAHQLQLVDAENFFEGKPDSQNISRRGSSATTNTTTGILITALGVPVPTAPTSTTTTTTTTASSSSTYPASLVSVTTAFPGVGHVLSNNNTNNDVNDSDAMLAAALQEEELRAAEHHQHQHQQERRARTDHLIGTGGGTSSIGSNNTGSENYYHHSTGSSRDSTRTPQWASSQQRQQQQQQQQGELVSVIDDPVWGRYESSSSSSSSSYSSRTTMAPPKPHIILCLSCCPCCVPPFCSDSRKQAYRRVGKSAAFIFSIIQLSCMISALCFRGFAPTGINPMLGPWPDTLDLMQAKNSALMIEKYQLWRLFTPIFLHAGLLHLATNLLMQLRLGLYLEVMWTTRVWVGIYMSSGIFASLFSAVLKPESISVGASGSLMGVLGAWLISLLADWGLPTSSRRPRQPTPPPPPQQQQRLEGSSLSRHQPSAAATTTRTRPTTNTTPPSSHEITSEELLVEDSASVHTQRASQLMLCLVNISIVIAFSFTPYVDWAAHLGGLVGGILMGCYYFLPGCISLSGDGGTSGGTSTTSGVRNSQSSIFLQRGSFLALLIYLGLVALGLVLLYSGPTVVEVNPQLLDYCGFIKKTYWNYRLQCPW